MADIQLTSGTSKHGRKKLSTRVDLTPMVDLGFLLITFFILTTTWTQVRAMRFYTPVGEADINVARSKTLTIIPGVNNKVFYYHGDLTDAINSAASGFTSYSEQTGIGELIREKKALLEKNKKGSSEDLVFIITPTANASYKNMVDAIDETLINDVKHYTVTEQNNAQLDALINAGKVEKGF